MLGPFYTLKKKKIGFINFIANFLDLSEFRPEIGYTLLPPSYQLFLLNKVQIFLYYLIIIYEYVYYFTLFFLTLSLNFIFS